jgi:hypothetical protein
MRFFRFMAIVVLLLACVVLGSACAGAKGETGAQGPKGDKGADGVGVQNIVNNGDGTFTVNLTNGESYTTDNLTGPRGEQGEQGSQGIQGLPGTPGIGVEWVGEWDSGTLYGKYDGVGYQGSSYISRQPNNTNHLPTDAAWWDLWVQKGNTGATGAAGADGADGQDGAPGPNMIRAMGYIASAGTVIQGYNIASCAWDPGLTRYLITFTGFSYGGGYYVVMVTPQDQAVWHASVASNGSGALLVYLYNNSNSTIQGDFCFMVLDTTA